MRSVVNLISVIISLLIILCIITSCDDELRYSAPYEGTEIVNNFHPKNYKGCFESGVSRNGIKEYDLLISIHEGRVRTFAIVNDVFTLSGINLKTKHNIYSSYSEYGDNGVRYEIYLSDDERSIEGKWYIKDSNESGDFYCELYNIVNSDK